MHTILLYQTGEVTPEIFDTLPNTGDEYAKPSKGWRNISLTERT